MVATAPPALRWLLLEHPGPWPARALDALEPALARGLAARAEALGARVALVRRPGRHPRRPGPLRWAVADARPGHEALRWSVTDDLREVLVADWDPAEHPGEGPGPADPVALVCTHARHDVCCAVRGRPVAAALEVHWPERVWECSHLGGDRFAASVVLLPHGLCYGRVEAADVAALLDAHESGRVLPGLLRGRSALNRTEQAAQALVRECSPSRDGLGDLLPLSSRRLDDDTTEVLLAGEPSLRVAVRERLVPLGTAATCRSTTPGVGYVYTLAGLEQVPADGPDASAPRTVDPGRL
jgi:hypothetical protein